MPIMKEILSMFFLFSLLLASITGCKERNSQSRKQEQERQELATFLGEIKGFANQTFCEDAAEWKFVAFGARGCGGPNGYVAYNKKVDEIAFLKKVTTYTNYEKAFNEKWGIVSTCELLAQPKSVECVNGKAKLVY